MRNGYLVGKIKSGFRLQKKATSMAMSKVRSQRVVDGTADNKDSELGFQMSCTLRLSAAQKQGNGEWLPGLMSASNQPPVLD
jgi:hypothetical protein